MSKGDDRTKGKIETKGEGEESTWRSNVTVAGYTRECGVVCSSSRRPPRGEKAVRKYLKLPFTALIVSPRTVTF